MKLLAALGLSVGFGLIVGAPGTPESLYPDWGSVDLSGRWQVVELGQAPVLGTRPPALVVTEGRVRGHTGCARFQGPLVNPVHHDRPGPMVHARAKCPYPVYRQQQLLLEALQQTRHALVEGQTLHLYDSHGTRVLRAQQ